MSSHTQSVAFLAIILTLLAELAIVGGVAIVYLLRDRNRP